MTASLTVAQLSDSLRATPDAALHTTLHASRQLRVYTASSATHTLETHTASPSAALAVLGGANAQVFGKTTQFCYTMTCSGVEVAPTPKSGVSLTDVFGNKLAGGGTAVDYERSDEPGHYKRVVITRVHNKAFDGLCNFSFNKVGPCFPQFRSSGPGAPMVRAKYCYLYKNERYPCESGWSNWRSKVVNRETSRYYDRVHHLPFVPCIDDR